LILAKRPRSDCDFLFKRKEGRVREGRKEGRKEKERKKEV